MLAWGEHSSRPVYIISVPGQSVPAGMPCQHDIFSCWATYIQIFFGKIHNIVTTTVTNSTNVEPVSYIYIIKPTGCQNNPGRVFPLDASASIPVLVALITIIIVNQTDGLSFNKPLERHENQIKIHNKLFSSIQNETVIWNTENIMV